MNAGAAARRVDPPPDEARRPGRCVAGARALPAARVRSASTPRSALLGSGTLGLSIAAGRSGALRALTSSELGAHAGRRTRELRQLRGRSAGAGREAGRARLVLGRHARPAAVRRAAARAGRVRPTPVGEVGRARDPGAARMARPGGRLVDQDRSARRDRARRRASWARHSCSIRSSSAAGAGAHVVAAARRDDLGRRAGGRLADRGGRRGRPAGRRGRRLLGRRGRAAARAAAVRRRADRKRDRAGRRAGPTGRGRASSTRRSNGRPARAADEPQRRDARAPTRRCERSRRRPTGPAPRSRQRSRRCCAHTGSPASLGPRLAARSPPTGCSTAPARCS